MCSPTWFSAIGQTDGRALGTSLYDCYCLLTSVLLPLDIVLVLPLDGHLVPLSCKLRHLARPAKKKKNMSSLAFTLSNLLVEHNPAFLCICLCYCRDKLLLKIYLITNSFDLIFIARDNDQNQNELKPAAKSNRTFSGLLIFGHCDVYVKARKAQNLQWRHEKLTCHE